MHRNVERILVITKYRFIGDTLTAVPTLRAVKEQWPDAKVTLLSGARACELLQNCPYIDHYVEFDPYRLCDKGLTQYIKMLSTLRKERFDLALVLNRSFHSALTAALGGVRRRFSWRGFEHRDGLLTGGCDYDPNRAEVECFLDIFRTAGGEGPHSRRLELWITDDELLQASKVLPAGDFLIGVQPGATHAYKQWPVSAFGELCKQLNQFDSKVKFVLIGGPEEKGSSEEFLRLSRPDVVERTTNLVGCLPLRMTLAAVSQMNAFVGNDTAIRHAAVAMDIPSIGLFGPTSCSKWGNSAPPRHIAVPSTTGEMDGICVETVLNSFVEIFPGLKEFGFPIKSPTSQLPYIGAKT
jgi:heptosyltransferase-2